MTAKKPQIRTKENLRYVQFEGRDFPKLAITSTTLRHNRLLRQEGYPQNVYTNDVLEIVRQFDTGKLASLKRTSEFNSEVKYLQQKIRENPDKLTSFFSWIELGYNLTKSESMDLFRLQVAAAFKYPRLFLAADITLDEAKSWIRDGEQFLKAEIKRLKRGEESMFLMPNIDMNLDITHFAPLNKWLVKEEYFAIGYTYRRPDKNNRANYGWVYNNSEEVFRHISNITWRKTTTALPTVLYALGFDSFAFVTTKNPVNQKRKDAETIHDIEDMVLKMFNRLDYAMAFANLIPTGTTCDCVVHRGNAINSNIRAIIQTGRSALFSSNHDTHGINIEFDKIKSGILSPTGFKRKTVLVTAARRFGVDFRQSRLP